MTLRPIMFKPCKNKKHIVNIYTALDIIPSVCNKFTTKDDLFYIIIQDGDKSFEALKVPKSLAVIIVVMS